MAKTHSAGKVVKITRNRESLYRGVCDCSWVTKDFPDAGEALDAWREHSQTPSKKGKRA